MMCVDECVGANRCCIDRDLREKRFVYGWRWSGVMTQGLEYKVMQPNT